MGIQLRLRKLIQDASATRREDILSSGMRLIQEKEMGGQYKFMSFTPKSYGLNWPFAP
jgi:SAM-dependent MidA family methyltransferase